MKVYTLTAFNMGIDNDPVLLEIFNKPKFARRWLDETLEIHTKNKWTKLDDRSRIFSYGEVEYVVQEWVVLTE